MALVGILTGSLNTSKRKALALMNEVFGVPMSPGGLSACEQQIAQVLAQPHQDLLDYLQRQTTARADETGWSRGNRQKGWLWSLCCHTVAVFLIQAGRGQKAAQKLLGVFDGILRLSRRVRNGTLGRATFERRMELLMRRVETLLARGADRGQPLAGRCRRIFQPAAVSVDICVRCAGRADQ